MVAGLAHWPKNYTRTEVGLSESVILYLANFARTGNPNEGTPEPGSPVSRPERSKLKNLEWTAYEAVHKKYISIDIKSKLKNHYRAHRLSFWLNLVPDLHKPGSDDVPRSHHLLDAEQVPPRFIQRLPSTSTRATTVEATSPTPTNVTTVQPSELAYEESTPQPEDGFAAYSTALSVTIAIGCSLLILNVLIFAGVYYQRDKNNQQPPPNGSSNSGSNYPKKRQENGQMPNNICGELEGKGSLAGSGGGHHVSIERHHHMQHHHLPPAVFADPPNNHHHNHGISVPMPPPPPKNAKPSIIATSDKLQSNQLLQQQQNLIISPNHLQQVEMGMSMQQAGSSSTLKRQQQHHHQLANQQQQQQQHQQQQQTIMEELRV
uniref:Carboxylesterase type B domain-containing protein n=1 Tax=Trichogramma kaykai TaxID=54128 RepID=A0ABD2XF24_9HYME